MDTSSAPAPSLSPAAPSPPAHDDDYPHTRHSRLCETSPDRLEREPRRNTLGRSSSRAHTNPADFYLQARTLSELDLHNLSLADMFEARHAAIADDDLLDALPPLGQSVVEEAEEHFRDLAHSALVFAATPAPSAAPSAAGSRAPSPSGERLRPTGDYTDPSYFALSRKSLYSDGGESSWSSAASSVLSTPSLWTSDASSYTESIACSPLPATPANESALDLLSLTSPTPSRPRSPPLVPSSSAKHPPPSIASRRANADPATTGQLKLRLPPVRTASFSTLRGGVPSTKSLKSPAAEPALSPLSAPSSPSLRAGSSLKPLTSVTGQGEDAGRLSRKPSWIRDLEAKSGVGHEAADGLKLRRKKSNGFAF